MDLIFDYYNSCRWWLAWWSQTPWRYKEVLWSSLFIKGVDNMRGNSNPNGHGNAPDLNQFGTTR